VVQDELAAYLALPQIKMKTERDATEWWQEHSKEFPNVAVMARQYLCRLPRVVCRRRDATVFSQVGIAFSAKRKRAESDTLKTSCSRILICREYVIICLVCTVFIIYIYSTQPRCVPVSTVLNTNNNTKEFNNSNKNNKDSVVNPYERKL
jgi:hypothetical protein